MKKGASMRDGFIAYVPLKGAPEVDAGEVASDPVRSPAHYAGDGEVDCARAMRSMAAGYDEAGAPCIDAYWALSALKYLWRAPLKGVEQDYRKAARCCEYAARGGEGAER